MLVDYNHTQMNCNSLIYMRKYNFKVHTPALVRFLGLLSLKRAFAVDGECKIA